MIRLDSSPGPNDGKQMAKIETTPGSKRACTNCTTPLRKDTPTRVYVCDNCLLQMVKKALFASGSRSLLHKGDTAFGIGLAVVTEAQR